MSAPTRLGKYEVRRELGKGSMGVVYEAFDPFIERRVAIKVIRQDELQPGQSRDLLTRLRREAQAAGRLNHPGIVAIYDYGEEDTSQGDSGLAYIAMELIDGRELKDYFDADHQFPPQDVVRIMDEVLAALQHAHERGVTHRDIKPSNVILLRNGRVKVADFGVARLDTSELTQAGTMIGTPMYMSPEQILGLPVDGRADLFSCGVVLYQFLTGEKPFTGSIATVMQKVLHHHPPPVTQLNATLAPAWDGVLQVALGKKPEERYASASAMAEAIRRAALEPSPGKKDEVTVLLPRPAAGVTLPPLGGPVPGRPVPMPPAAAPRSTSPGSAPGGAQGSVQGSAPGVVPVRPPAAAPAHPPAGNAATGAAGAKPAVSPTWAAAAGNSSAAPAAGRQTPFLNAQATSTSALATVVANALSGPSTTLRPPPPPPRPAPTVPQLGKGPRAVALAVVLGGAALAAYLAWSSDKRQPGDGPVPQTPAASQAPAASRTAPVPTPLQSQPTASQSAGPSAAEALSLPATPAIVPAPGPATPPSPVSQADPVPAAASKAAATAPRPPAPSPPPVAAAAPSPAPPQPTAAPAPAGNPEWRPRLAKLEALRGPQSLANAMATLLEPFSAEERALATEFEAQFKQRPMANALVIGVIDGHFRANWQTRGLSAERAGEQARRRCLEQSATGCSVVMLNGEFQREGLLTAARELGSQPPGVVRTRVLRAFERSLAEWRQVAETSARAPSASPAYPAAAPAPVAVAPTPTTTPAATSTARSSDAQAAEAARAEWTQALAHMRNEAPSSMSRGLELLLRATGEDSDRLARFQSALKRMRWNSAVAMGERNGYLVFAWIHSERRADWAQERALADCNRAAATPCAVVMSDGSYANAGLMSVGMHLGGRSQQVVRENFMRYVQRKLQEGLG